MVETVLKEFYKCGVCGTEYPFLDKAQACEEKGFSPKYQKGQKIEFRVIGYHAPYTGRGIVGDIVSIDRSHEPTYHILRFINEENRKALIELKRSAEEVGAEMSWTYLEDHLKASGLGKFTDFNNKEICSLLDNAKNTGDEVFIKSLYDMSSFLCDLPEHNISPIEKLIELKT